MAYSNPAQAAISPLSFTVNLNEAVNVNTSSGTPRITLNVGGQTRYATYASGTGTAALTFTYTPTIGDIDLDGIQITPAEIDLNSGTIADLNGNAMNPVTFTAPNTSNIKVNYPTLSMDFTYDSDGRYTLNGTAYDTFTAFLSAAGGTYTRASTATYYDSSGIIQTAASGAARFNYDPTTHSAKGLLIEESRTNIVRSSENFGGTGWGLFRITKTNNAATAPNNASTATYLVRNSTTQSAYIQNVLASGSTGMYAASIFVKAGTVGGRLGLRLQGTYPDRGEAVFNIQTGTIVGTNNGGNWTGTTAEIISLPNGWYQLKLITTAAVSNLAFLVLGPSDSTRTVASWEATSTVLSDCYVWGAQVESGSSVTSYIPTTTATVNRPVDTLTIPTGSWFSGTEGTLFTNAFIGTKTASATLLQIDNGSENNAHKIRANTSNALENVTLDGAVAQSSITSVSTLSQNTTYKMAYGYSLNNFAASASGNINTDSSGTLPSGLTTLRVGSNSTGEQPSSTIKEIRFYPLRAANAQLQLLTQ